MAVGQITVKLNATIKLVTTIGITWITKERRFNRGTLIGQFAGKSMKHV